MTSTENSVSIQQSKKEFLCTYDDCLKKFSSLTHLNRHEASYHIKQTYRCEECGATFKTQYAQKRHMDNKHLKKKLKKYKCDYCEEDFNKKSWLNRHIFKHTGIKPYACTFENCDARFIVPSKLRRHMKMHEGYICPKENCNVKFSKWSEVRKHLKLVHPKVYKCPECEQEFSRSNNLRSHMLIHRTDRLVFLCPREGCHRFYSSKHNLNKHISDYHEKRPFNCTVGKCFRIFKSQDELDVHISKHNPSGRLKKKKKKNKPKPSLAEELAGLAPKKWQIDLLNDASKSNNAKPTLAKNSDSPCIQDNSELESENTTDTLEIMMVKQETSCIDENCDIVSPLNREVEENNKNFNVSINDELDAHISKHNPSGQLKKKKKKNKPKPSLAEELAGLAPKKWQVDLLNGASNSDDAESTVAKNSDPLCIQDDSEPESENTADILELMMVEQETSCIDENCDKVSPLIGEVEENNSNLNISINDSDNDSSIENDDIQTLLNLVQKRKDFEAASAAQEIKCISIKV